MDWKMYAVTNFTRYFIGNYDYGQVYKSSGRRSSFLSLPKRLFSLSYYTVVHEHH